MLEFFFLTFYILVAFFFAIKCDIGTLVAFEVMLGFQNLFLVMLSGQIDSSFHMVFSAVKEIMLYGALVLAIFRYRKKIDLDTVTILAVVFIFILCVGSIASGVGLGQIGSSLRQLMIPVMGIFVGKYIGVFDLGKLTRSLVVFAAILGVLGLFELFVLGDRFWLANGLADFLRNRGSERIMYTRGMPANFYTYDFSDTPIRRMASITAEPLATAHILFLGFVICSLPLLLRQRKADVKNLALVALFGICCLLSFSKAVYLGIAIEFFCVFYYRLNCPSAKKAAIVCLLSLIVAAIVLLFKMPSVLPDSLVKHMSGLIEGVVRGGAFGHGVGTSGYSTLVSTAIENKGGESFFGVLLMQVGFVGALAFCLLYFSVLFRSIQSWRKTGGWEHLATMVLFWMLLLDMLLSESAVSAIGTSLFFVFAGSVVDSVGGVSLAFPSSVVCSFSHDRKGDLC